MSEQDLSARLEAQPITVECPICRHNQRLGTTSGRCDQCGSEIDLYDERRTAEERLGELISVGRVAYLREIGRDVFAVIANRSFDASNSS